MSASNETALSPADCSKRYWSEWKPPALLLTCSPSVRCSKPRASAARRGFSRCASFSGSWNTCSVGSQPGLRLSSALSWKTRSRWEANSLGSAAGVAGHATSSYSAGISRRKGPSSPRRELSEFPPPHRLVVPSPLSPFRFLFARFPLSILLIGASLLSRVVDSAAIPSSSAAARRLSIPFDGFPPPPPSLCLPAGLSFMTGAAPLPSAASRCFFFFFTLPEVGRPALRIASSLPPISPGTKASRRSPIAAHAVCRCGLATLEQ
mmetsp:Transcript_31688/g.79354  ORF Transcript_31688/g.79354 Transcript_31688/m.79354 type:complete len:264 (+) Transcript_31688:735-1526(+)